MVLCPATGELLSYQILIEKSAKKGLRNAPCNVRNKFAIWVQLVELRGINEARKIPGFHDEPLLGKRKGQRSIRLNKAWRAIYRESSGILNLVTIEEVSKHEY
ncbi:MAG: hypothetical protein R3B45_00155 [Bdellovibrionota bacterium]